MGVNSLPETDKKKINIQFYVKRFKLPSSLGKQSILNIPQVGNVLF